MADKGGDPLHDQKETASVLSRRGFFMKAGLGLAGAGAAGLLPLDAEAAFRARVAPTDSLYRVTQLGYKKEILANGIANHAVGKFPNQNCPASIRAVQARYLVDSYPSGNSYATPVNGWLFGIARSGVPFDPTGPFWSNTPGNVWQFEVLSTVARPYLGLDGNNAHVQPNGEYHYHGIPQALIATLQRTNVGKAPLHLGWAADGFPIYGPWGYADPMDPNSPVLLMKPSYRLKSGKRPAGAPKGNFDGSFVQDYEFVPGSGDLDACNGRYGYVSETPGVAYQYHYYITESFPFVPRFYWGTPDSTFYHPLPGQDAIPAPLLDVGY